MRHTVVASDFNAELPYPMLLEYSFVVVFVMLFIQPRFLCLAFTMAVGIAIGPVILQCTCSRTEVLLPGTISDRSCSLTERYAGN